MDLLGYFRVLRRRWAVIALLAVIGAGLGYASTLLKSGTGKEQTYCKATSTLQLDPSTSEDAVSTAFSSPEQVAIYVTTGAVPDAVAKKAGTSESGRELAQHVVTLTNSVPNTIEITYADADCDRAVQLSDAFAAELMTNIDARAKARYDKRLDELNKQVAQLKAQADAFLAQITTVPPPPDRDTIQRQYDATQNEYYTKFSQRQTLITQGPPQSQLSQLERASGIPISKGEYESRLSLGASGQNNLRVETSNGEPVIDVSSGSSSAVSGPLARTLLGLLLGLLAGIGLALLLDRLDHRIRSRSEAEEAFQLPVLAEVPTFSRTQQKQQVIVATDAPRSRAAEAYRAIRTSLLFQQASIQASDPAVPALNGHSNGAGNGQANGTSADVAEPFEHLDDLFEDQPAQRLALMVTSASPREGKTNTTANLAVVFAEAGASVLVVNCDFRRPSVHKLFGLEDIPRTVQSTSVPGVKLVTNVLTDPNANPAQVIAAQRQVIAAARDRFDVIILDTAPILTANDAVEVVGSADLVLLVARANVTTADGAERSVDVLSRLGAPMGGVVLVASGESSSQYYYYYQQGQSGSRRRVGRKSEPDDAPAPLGS